jgi:hypothetical protein
MDVLPDRTVLIEVNDNRFLSSMLVHHKSNATHGVDDSAPNGNLSSIPQVSDRKSKGEEKLA